MPFKKGNKINVKRIFSEEHRKNMSLAKTGDKNPLFGTHPSLETRKKIILAQTGKKHTEEWKNNIGNALKGHKVSIDTRDKISRAKTGKKLAPFF